MADPPAKKPETADDARTRVKRFHGDLGRRNHYQLLGVDKDTDPEKIKANYHSLAKRWHSDAFTGFELGAEKAKLDEIFQRIGEAYATLSDKQKREEYNVLLDRQSKGLATDVGAVFQAEQLVDNALIKLRKREWAAAKEDLEKALKLNPGDSLYSTYLAWVRYNSEKKNEATVKEVVGLLKAAIAKQESNATAYHYLGQICFDAEKFDEARKWWRMCLEWEPNNVEAGRGIRLAQARGDAKKKKPGLMGLLDKLMGKG